MLNQDKLKKVADSYKAIFQSRWSDESFKWSAIKWFQEHWDINAVDFADMFATATEIKKTNGLLNSMNNFPQRMIIDFAKADREGTRAMFINLYDESKNITERVEKFQADSEQLRIKYDPGTWQQHYQKPMAITVYLWLRYPEKYYIYKYSVCKVTALELESDFVPIKGHTAENLIGNEALFNEIKDYICKDQELIDMYRAVLTEEFYQDSSMRNIAFDIGFYVTNTYNVKAKELSSYPAENNQSPELEKIEFATNPQVQYEKYDKEDFLREVYMKSEQYDMLNTLLTNKQNLILQGAPGVGKTFAAKRLAYSIIGKKDESRVEMIQFHQNYSYEDFVMGYRPQEEGFALQNGIFYRFCQKAANNSKEPYFFIIDEINRGNMSKIFGELLMLIEKDYRGTEMTLAYNGMPFSVPMNLYIIGMMNTADRSIAMIDYALRRRFSFFEMETGFLSDGFVRYRDSFENDTFSLLIERIKSLNKEIANDTSLGNGFCIGHSYFCGKKSVTDEWMEAVVEYDVLPMLREYWFDEPVKVKKWTNILMGVFND